MSDKKQDIKQRVSERIRTIRKIKGWTQKELGEKMELTESTINQYESGRKNPTLTTVERFAQSLEVEITELMK